MHRNLPTFATGSAMRTPSATTGVARDDVNSRLTPVALAVPAPLVVDFHLQWAPQAEADLDESRLHAASG